MLNQYILLKKAGIWIDILIVVQPDTQTVS